ncbi:MAG: 5,10-methylenetetrahydrofolate reductase [Thermoplasmata archaeon]|nr:MAG: 5,10-methylenetetrahydrofolate reductase [Thermoplasmata archaeon]
MIVTKQKELDYLLKSIANKPVFIIGCSECATLCHTGGEEEVVAMKKILEEKDIKVTGWVILEPACHLQNNKRILRGYKEEIKDADKILVLACGNGVQAVSEVLKDKNVISGTDTLFLGEIKHLGDFERRCDLCGDCIQDLFFGLCPIARCPKHMLNGPCGGSRNGKCEVYHDMDCVWDLIIKKMQRRGELDRLKRIRMAKDWSKSNEMQVVL